MEECSMEEGAMEDGSDGDGDSSGDGSVGADISDDGGGDLDGQVPTLFNLKRLRLATLYRITRSEESAIRCLPAPSSMSSGLPLAGFGQPNGVYHRAPLPTLDNPADFGNGLSNPPPVPQGFDPNHIPYSHWSVMTSNNPNPYGYRAYAEHNGMPQMTGMTLNGQQIGKGGFLRGFFPVPTNQAGMPT